MQNSCRNRLRSLLKKPLGLQIVRVSGLQMILTIEENSHLLFKEISLKYS